MGTAQLYEDILVGSAGNDHIMSGEQNDDVGGRDGYDWIEGLVRFDTRRMGHERGMGAQHCSA